MTGPNYPDLRQRVRQFAESQWGEPDGVVLLGRIRPGYEVPSRRNDGTIVGKRLIRRFFWNILRGAAFGVGYVIAMLLTFENPGGDMKRYVGVRGRANAQALGLTPRERTCPRSIVMVGMSSGATAPSTPMSSKVMRGHHRAGT
nr:hypothetical protein [Kibdelosporangium sp. MJ126-NF4]CTQ92380.1 hypothetical protein [Kibdelosporangium sp. MJ126-NF4]